MTFSGQQKWIPLGILDWVMVGDFYDLKLVVSHSKVSMMMGLGWIYFGA